MTEITTTTSSGTATYTASYTPTKKWYRSKANWTAIATFIAAIVPMFLSTNTGLIGDELALRLTGITAFISAVIQFAIRTFATSEPIA